MLVDKESLNIPEFACLASLSKLAAERVSNSWPAGEQAWSRLEGDPYAREKLEDSISRVVVSFWLDEFAPAAQ